MYFNRVIYPPWLLLLFFIDIDYCFKHCELKCFADDLKICSIISNVNDCSVLQEDLNRLQK